MTVITDYLNLQREQEEKYGERTVLLYQIGTFYECYEYNIDYCTSKKARVDKEGNVWNKSIGHAINLSVVLNCVLALECNDNVYGINNPHKVGFPVVSYEKNRNTLLSNDYTIVRVDQQKNTNNKGKVERFIAEVCSPTMNLENISLARPTSNIVSIYIEYQQGDLSKKNFDKFLITTGISVIDVITGTNRVCEFYSKVDDQVHAVQELYRFLIAHYPRELIININDMPAEFSHHSPEKPNPYVRYIEKVLELQRFDRMTININSVPVDYFKVAYQTDFFNKIFGSKSVDALINKNEKIIEHLGLERLNYGRLSYMCLLQHCYKHNTEIISRLSRPDISWLDNNKHLILTHNALLQLDIISIDDFKSTTNRRRSAEIKSLMSILDQTRTHLGKRYLSNIIKNPMCIAEDIAVYYDMIDEMMNTAVNDEPLWLYLDKALKELPDIGRLQRKLELKLITPKELSILFRSYVKIVNIYITTLQLNTPTIHKNMFSKTDVDSFNGYLARFNPLINFDHLETCNVDTSSEHGTRWMTFTQNPIRTGYFPDLDEYSVRLLNAETSLQNIVDHLNTFLTRSTGRKLSFNSAKKKQGATKQDPTGTVITSTHSKIATLLSSNYDVNLCGHLQGSAYTSSEKILTSDKITELCNEIDHAKTWMRTRIYNIYEMIIDEMVSQYTFYVPLCYFISRMDLVQSYAKVSFRNNYYRPEFIDSEDSKMQVTDLRHPIIEQIIDGTYVTNDLSLGPGMDSNGILLFGINTSGKSSMAKALGVNIIMAQAGCFVPSRLRYRPYNKIITRLSGGDNMLGGESTFEVEMKELRTILRQVDNNTLAIGDEIASGTESNSATVITGSSVLQLISKQSTFIFATHMHELLNLSHIKNIPKDQLRVCHLSITYDESNDMLLYDRKLKPGPGLSSYGLMVARSLGLPKDFINLANEMLLEITKQNKDIVTPKKSRYNVKVYVDSCANCGQNSNTAELHTHHIIEQSKSVDDIVQKINNEGVVGSLHKNKKDNLIVLCRSCHTNLHGNNQELERIETSTGSIVRLKE